MEKIRLVYPIGFFVRGLPISKVLEQILHEKIHLFLPVTRQIGISLLIFHQFKCIRHSVTSNRYIAALFAGQ